MVQSGPRSGAFRTKASSTSIRGAMEAIGRNRRGVGIEHVVEQHAVIRLGDPDCVLHRLRSQADLVALDDAAAASCSFVQARWTA